MIGKPKDPGSAITHFIGMITAILFAVPLILKASSARSIAGTSAVSVFIVSTILLYAASTIYHTFDISEKVNRRLRKMDHIMISVMIAGTYTPMCAIVIKGHIGLSLLAVIWSLALVGILIKAFWITCPRWFSSVLYIAMGWVCVLAFTPLKQNLSTGGLALLVAGGIIYTIGGIIYALKLPIFNSRHKNFGSHEIFHLFVMGGSLCHGIMIYQYVIPLIF